MPVMASLTWLSRKASTKMVHLATLTALMMPISVCLPSSCLATNLLSSAMRMNTSWFSLQFSIHSFGSFMSGRRARLSAAPPACASASEYPPSSRYAPASYLASSRAAISSGESSFSRFARTAAASRRRRSTTAASYCAAVMPLRCARRRSVSLSSSSSSSSASAAAASM